MSIKKNFKGASINKPGSYSSTTVKDDNANSITSEGAILIVGESEKGAPGDAEGIKVYDAAQFGALITEFGSGPIVDCARAARIPSKTPGIQGAQQYFVWKTNSSTRATMALENGSATDVMTLNSANWGEQENLINVTVNVGSTANKRQITIERGDEKEELSENAEQSQIQIQYTGAGSASTMTIAGATLGVKNLTTTVTGGPGGETLSIALSGKTIKDIVDLISANTAYTVTLTNAQSGTVTPATDLDVITASDIMTTATDLFRNNEELSDIINDESELVTAIVIQNVAGNPAVAAKAFMSGAVKGASASSDFSAGFAASLSKFVNVILPAISRDATDDILDGLTDASSAYDIDSILAAMDTNLRLRGQIKNRKEAQGMGGHRSSTIATSYALSQSLASELIQLCVQDVEVQDEDANSVWRQPHVEAAMMAGIRLGTEIGEPLTTKTLNCSGIGHAVNTTTGISGGDFDADLDFQVAIDNGILFAEQLRGGIAVVVDNTTYGKDQNFVWNRGSVIEAAHFIARSLRARGDLTVGGKTVAGLRSTIDTNMQDELEKLFKDRITSKDDEAPTGWKNLSVVLEGNTALIKVHVKPIQGLDFVLIEIELGDSRVTA